jgi:hypothetical protein
MVGGMRGLEQVFFLKLVKFCQIVELQIKNLKKKWLLSFLVAKRWGGKKGVKTTKFMSLVLIV